MGVAGELAGRGGGARQRTAEAENAGDDAGRPSTRGRRHRSPGVRERPRPFSGHRSPADPVAALRAVANPRSRSTHPVIGGGV